MSVAQSDCARDVCADKVALNDGSRGLKIGANAVLAVRRDDVARS